MSRLGRLPLIALAAVLPLVATLELLATFVVPAPEASNYEPLESAVAPIYQPGDLVVMSPRWAEPHARAVLGDHIMRLEDLARSDAQRYPRAIEISLDGARSSELAAFRVRGEHEVGPFTVRELENPSPERVIYDFLEHVAPEDLSVSGTEPLERCRFTMNAEVLSGGLGGNPTFPRRRFQCSGGAFFGVGVTVIADEDFLPRRCIFAHPTERGARVLRFDHVPLGERIVGHLGMYTIIERARGAPVDLELVVDGETLGTIHHEDGQGWKRFDVPLGAHSGASSATVEMRVHSPDYVDRHFCFEATVR